MAIFYLTVLQFGWP